MSSTLDRWDEYVQEYESGMNQAQQAYDNMSNSDKQSNAEDMAKQKAYLEWMKSKSSEFHEMEQQGQEIPSTVSLDNVGMGVGFYTWGDDATTYHLGYLHTFTATQNADIISAEHFHLVLQEINIHPYYGSSWLIPPGYDDYYGVYWEWGTITSQYNPSGSESVGTLYPLNRAPAESAFKFVDTTGNLQGSPYNAAGGIGPSWWVAVQARPVGQIPHFDNTTALDCAGCFVRSPYLGNVITVDLGDDDIDTSKPWDFYNDELLPDLNPDIAAFPNGYDPQEPPDPDDDNPGDEPDVGDVDGEFPDTQLDANLFCPAVFLTQYILTYSEVSQIGRILWSSWNNPSSEVEKNFLFNLSQDTGTFDITSALNFVVSLRIYPFDIRKLFTNIGTGSGVWMGAGHTNFCPNPQGASIWHLTTFTHALFAGKCKLYPTKPYKDFRDMYNASVTAFLPFCGTVDLNPVEVMYKELSCYYLIDFSNGGCTAIIKVNNSGKEYIVASKSGQIGVAIPITATNTGQVAAQQIRDATNVVGTIGGFFFDVASSIANSAEKMAMVMAKSNGDESETKGTGMTASTSIGLGQKGFNTGLSLANQALDMLSRSGIDVPMLSGGGGAEAVMLSKTPYIQLRRGRYAKPDNYPHSVGNINGSSAQIKEYRGKFSGSPPTGMPSNKGLCQFTGIDSTGLHCHEEEKMEIIQLLESGVYL
jgi:hypothetical protein